MPLSSQQHDALTAKATALGIDPDELIAAAEEELASAPGDKAAAKSPPASTADTKAAPPLYQYHLPFVTVNEVRTIWLGLPAIDGGDMNAAAWTAKQAAGTSPPTTTAAAPAPDANAKP